MNRPPQFPIPVTAAGHTPLRRPGSIRRTTSIDSAWPEGLLAPRIMRGGARDLLTTGEAQARELARASFALTVSPRREILALETAPAWPEAQDLVGVAAGTPGGSSRARLAAALGHRAGEPLYQLLDDYSGASLVSVWAWMRWAEVTGEERPTYSHPFNMVDICIGHAAGASSLRPDGSSNHEIQKMVPVGPFVNPADPDGWHALALQVAPAHRRARRIDVWRDGAAVKVDSWFQDSAAMPDGGRIAVHEYAVNATVDVAGIITELTADALILPYAECPGSVTQVHRLIGKPAAGLRDTVSVELAGPLGCTHLNDVLRALADVPALAAQLPVESLA